MRLTGLVVCTKPRSLKQNWTSCTRQLGTNSHVFIINHFHSYFLLSCLEDEHDHIFNSSPSFVSNRNVCQGLWSVYGIPLKNIALTILCIHRVMTGCAPSCMLQKSLVQMAVWRFAEGGGLIIKRVPDMQHAQVTRWSHCEARWSFSLYVPF